MSRNSRTICWKLTTQPSKKTITCDICKKQLCYTKGSTTNLLRHLKNRHPFELAPYEEIHPAPSLLPMKTATATSSTSSASAPQQLTTMQTMQIKSKYKADSDRKRQIDDCVLDLVTVDLQHMNIVENKAFWRLVAKLDPRYEMISRKRLSTQLLAMKYQAESAKLMEELRTIDHMAVTTDCWTFRATESFCTMTVHFITPEWKLRSQVLATRMDSERHTAENLSSVLKDIFSSWGIDEKVTHIVTDNAANIKKPVDLCNRQHDGCFAHSLNLVVKEAIRITESVAIVKDKVKKIVIFFHHSTVASNSLKEAHKTKGTDPRKLKKDVETRWNSTYEKLCQSSTCLAGKSGLCLTSTDLAIANDSLESLIPFYEETVEMSTERHTSLAKVIPLVHQLTIITGEDNTVLGMTLHQKLMARFRNLETKEHLMLVPLLDPRFKQSGFPDAHSSAVAVEKLEEVAQSVRLLVPSTQPEDQDERPRPGPSTSKPQGKLWAIFDQKIKENKETAAPVQTAAQIEVRRHLEMTCIDRKDDPLDWWRKAARSTPRLEKIAKDLLAIPATSVPSTQ